ncbi:MAG: glycosyltransferase family 2 protein [bacterium]|nr:glycosyltransferase family 2 protein [bacterium]
MHTVSVVIPLHDNEGIVEACLREVGGVLARLQGEWFADYEIVFVDDGSTDGTLRRLLALCGHDPRVKVVELDANYGQHAALCAGFEAASGDVIVTLDSDLQVPPDQIPRLLERIGEGHDLVGGVRVGRRDPLLGRVLPSRLFNAIAGRMTGTRLRDWGCPAVAIRTPLAKQILRYGEMRRFLKPLGVRLARSVAEIEVAHRPRIGGRSGYGVQDLFELALDFVTNFSRRPFQKVSLAGTALFALGVLGGILYLVLRFGLGAPPGVRAQALVFLAVVVGLQLMILGFLGEFIIRIYRRQNELPFYTVRAVHTARGD